MIGLVYSIHKVTGLVYSIHKVTGLVYSIHKVTGLVYSIHKVTGLVYLDFKSHTQSIFTKTYKRNEKLTIINTDNTAHVKTFTFIAPCMHIYNTYT